MPVSPWGVLAAGAALLAAPSAGHADWLVYGGNPQHNGVATEALPAPLSVSWKHATDYQKDNTASPIVVGDMVYFASKDRVYAVRADSGELVWKSPGGDQPGTTQYRSTPAVANGTVFVGNSDGGMYALDARTGVRKWRFVTGATVRSHPLVVGDILYFGSDDNHFYAINTKTAELIWKVPTTDDVATAATLAADSDELIYFASTDGHLYAVNRLTGRRKWSARTVGASAGNSPVAFQNRIFLAAGNKIFSFRTRTGTSENLIHSTLAPESDITCTPIFTTDPSGDPTRPVAFFGDRYGNFYCYQQSRLTWKPIWKQKLDGGVTAMPVQAGGLVFAGVAKSFVYALNAVDGTVQWRYHLEAPLDLRTKYRYFNISAPLVVANQRLYVLSDDGTLNAFGTDGIDVAGPVITQPRPSRGTMVNGLPPYRFSAYLWDAGTGIKPESVTVRLDGKPLEPSKFAYDERRGLKPGVVYDPVQRKVEYNSPRPEAGQVAGALPNGRHVVQVEATDWKGNTSTMEWSFLVDNTLPVRPRVQPGATGVPGARGAPGYGNPGTAGQRGRPQPRRRPTRGQGRQPAGTPGAPGYGR